MRLPQSDRVEYAPLKHFLFRVPALPYSAFERLQRIIDDHELIGFLSDDIVSNAIYVASQSLFHELFDSITIGKSLEEKARLSFIRYLERMSSRCTPFGLFATVSIGAIDASSEADVLSFYKRLIPHLRFDTKLAVELSIFIKQCPELREQLCFYPNNSLYRVGTSFRYIEPIYTSEHLAFKISSAVATEYLELLIREARKGIRIEELVALLIDRDVDPDSALQFVLTAIESSILMAETDVSITGILYHKRLKAILEKTKPFENRDHLYQAVSILGDGNRGDVASIRLLIDNTLKHSISSFLKRDYKGDLIQVDSKRMSLSATIGTNTTNELISFLRYFPKIATPMENQAIEDFKKVFLQRYDQRTISLTEALDSELGIGYPVNHGLCDRNSLVDTFQHPQNKRAPTTHLSELEKLIVRKLSLDSSSGTNAKVVRITESEIKSLISEPGELPQMVGVLFQLVNNNPVDPSISLLAVSSTPLNLIARFGFLGEEFESFISEIVEKEKTPATVIKADVVCFPDARIGNIVSRPHIREYEIPLYTISDYPKQQQIPVSDLFISIKEGRIVLSSKSLGKEVFPTQNSAHAYSRRTTPIYHFLCDLQYQSHALSFEAQMTGILNLLGYCPRIVFKRIILSPATWIIKASDILHFKTLDGNVCIESIASWREPKGIPQIVIFSQADNNLLVDFNSINSVKAFFAIIKEKSILLLKEFLFLSPNLVAQDEEKNYYTNECFVPFSLIKNSNE